ncbi:hypothetical protein TWF718_009837 [Orbilia javanica]|uniref:Caspase domain-containing protein n=1 Tax=Orbilia javanica TaxID=47235 RepID=A0AAN8N0A4_9PEZI
MDSPTVPLPGAKNAFRRTDEAMRMLNEVEEALQQRKYRYELVFVVTVYFQTDDTGAQEDSATFATGMKQMLGLPGVSVIECMIPRRVDAADFWLLEIRPKIEAITNSTKGRKLLILHFAGHGTVDSRRGLVLEGGQANTPETVETFDPYDKYALEPPAPKDYLQFIEWGTIRSSLFDKARRGALGALDIIVILDCCYAGVFGIGTTHTHSKLPFDPHGAVIEILAATDKDTRTPMRRLLGGQATFTQKFISVMREMVGHVDKPPITIPKVLAILNTRKQPGTLSAVYDRLGGSAPILFPVTTLGLPPQTDTSKPDLIALGSWRQPCLYLALEIHFTRQPDEATTTSLVRWLLQAESQYDLRVNGVFKAESTIIHLTLSYESLYLFHALRSHGIVTIKRTAENLYSQNLIRGYIDTKDDVARAAKNYR